MLPGIRERVNYKGIAIETGIPHRQFEQKRELRLLVDAVLDELGVANGAPNEQPRRILDSEVRTPLTTYSDLKSSGLIWLREHGYSKASIASYHSHLNAFMRHFGRTDKSSTAKDFGLYFESQANAFLQAEGKSNVVRSALNLWSRIHGELHQSIYLPADFAAALTELVVASGRTKRDIARSAGVKVADTVGDWMRGDRRPSDPERIAKLEEVLNVLPGTLSSKLFFGRTRRATNIPKEWWPESWQKLRSDPLHRRDKVVALIPEHLLMVPPEQLKPAFDDALQKVVEGHGEPLFRQKLRTFRKKVYWLSHADWSDQLKAEFLALKEYKTAPSGLGNKKRRGSWRDRSADMALGQLESFFGFLRLPADHHDIELRGMGLSLESLTLAWLTVPEIVERFLDFRRTRSGAYNAATETFISTWGALLQPESGWLWLHPELLERLPEPQWELVGAAGGWKAYCVAAHTELRASLASLQRNGEIRQTREPMLPIWPILDHPEPLSLINDALTLTRQDLEARVRPNEMFSSGLAAAWRDYMLLCLLVRFPLRAKHWGMFTYNKDGSGYLQNHPRDGWRLVIPYDDFKNVRNKTIFTLHNRERVLTLNFSKLQPLKQLIPLLEFYLEKIHPVIVGEGNFLFPTRGGEAVPGSYIYARVKIWTREYLSQHSTRQTGIKGVFSFGPHAFRDIVATHIIKTTGSISLAANILLDSEEMVRQHYARFLPEDRIGLAMAELVDVFEPDEDL